MSRKLLYLGLNPERYEKKGGIIYHYPVISIVPRPLEDPSVKEAIFHLPHSSHLIVTSQTTIPILIEYGLKVHEEIHWLRSKQWVVVGLATASCLKQHGIEPAFIAKQESAEGIVTILEELFEEGQLQNAHLFYPHSSQSRPLIEDFLKKKKVVYRALPLYEPRLQSPLPIPSLEEFDEIVFTSPSTVDGFFKIFKAYPRHIKLTCIGSITENYLSTFEKRKG